MSRNQKKAFDLLVEFAEERGLLEEEGRENE